MKQIVKELVWLYTHPIGKIMAWNSCTNTKSNGKKQQKEDDDDNDDDILKFCMWLNVTLRKVLTCTCIPSSMFQEFNLPFF